MSLFRPHLYTTESHPCHPPHTHIHTHPPHPLSLGRLLTVCITCACRLPLTIELPYTAPEAITGTVPCRKGLTDGYNVSCPASAIDPKKM